MDGADALLEGLAGGDKVPMESMPEPPPAPTPSLKREQDSTDDFEHLGSGGGHEAGESPLNAPRAAAHAFLEAERGPELGAPLAEPLAVQSSDKLSDHLADKFTDSESDADASPLHRAQLPPPRDPTPVLQSEPALPPPMQPAPAPVPDPVPTAPEPRVELPPQPPAGQQEPPRPMAHVIEAEVIFCQMGLDAWFDPQRLHPEVESLIYWRNPGRSGAALGAGLALLVALASCSVVSVLAYSALLTLSAAVAFRVYKNVLQAVQKTNEGHPFKWLLEAEVSVPAERAQSLAAAATAHLNAALHELRRLFLVEDLVDSLKFGVLLWCLTYVGACFNGITIIILGWISLFTLPKAYEMNKAQVDANLELARAKINDITAKVRAAVPLGRKAESEKDK